MSGQVLLASTAHATSAPNGKGDSFGSPQVAIAGSMTLQPSAASPAGESRNSAPASAGPGQAEDEQAMSSQPMMIVKMDLSWSD